MCLQIKVLGHRSDRPSLSKLNTHVVQKVAAKWEELVFELLNNGSAQPILNNIKADHNREVCIYNLCHYMVLYIICYYQLVGCCEMLSGNVS